MTDERLKVVLAMLESFALLSRKATDEIGWIALKFSCSRMEADRLIREARRERE